ncbi:THAP-type domain-containing protein [Caerostris darwini]|uniref:THAP-type domain-containing protein n=1 Tax=Caerostris darwini TaxID=1538125 RepID=A0AAV4S7A4_9ARAC|nr:THAP-type domain-containing protein [Caerostris darwini]
MRSYCCIPNCNSSSIDKEPGLSFHEFPTKSHYRNRWLKAITTLVAPDFCLIDKIKTKVCSKHFKETDFSTMCSKRRRLKGCAVPSVFPECEFNHKFVENKVLEFEIIFKKDGEESFCSNKNYGLQNNLLHSYLETVVTKEQSFSKDISAESQESENYTLDSTEAESSVITEREQFSELIFDSSNLDLASKSNYVYDNVKIKDDIKFNTPLNNNVEGLKRISAQESNLSEFTIFGLYIASQLQQLPIEEAYALKEKIQNLLTQSCPKSLKEPSFFSYIQTSDTDLKSDSSLKKLHSESPIVKKSLK